MDSLERYNEEHNTCSEDPDSDKSRIQVGENLC